MVYSIGVPVTSPMSPPACLLGMNGPNATVSSHTFLPPIEHNHMRRDGSVIFSTTCGKEFRLARKVLLEHDSHNNMHTRCAQGVPSALAAPTYMRVVHVIRLLLEDKLNSPIDIRGLKKESRRSGRRTSITRKATFTLAEWEALVQHVRTITSGYVICTPESCLERSTGMGQKELTVEVADFMTLMMTLGRYDRERFVRYVAVSRNIKRSATVNSPLCMQLIGDYVKEEPPLLRPVRTASANDQECIITLVTSLTAVETPSRLPVGHESITLRRASCEWDARERAFVSPMQLNAVLTSPLVGEISSDTRDANRMVFSCGEKRKLKLIKQRFMGYCWTRLSRLDPRRLFFDDEDAPNIIGDITFMHSHANIFGGATASELKTLCDEKTLLGLFGSLNSNLSKEVPTSTTR